MKKYIILLLIFTSFLSLVACGRYANPVSPQGGTYPSTYSVQ